MLLKIQTETLGASRKLGKFLYTRSFKRKVRFKRLIKPVRHYLSPILFTKRLSLAATYLMNPVSRLYVCFSLGF